jgi:hypothetical protein
MLLGKKINTTTLKIIIIKYTKAACEGQYLYIFEEFMPWFQQLLKSPEVKNKTKPIDLFKHQKLTKFNGAIYGR